jgi:acyl-CoA synthetase (AMP-forming)/AMP-acid ligase II/aryl carrier-like protein
LLTGATLVVARPKEHGNPGYLANLIRDCNITTLHFVPSMLQSFLDGTDSQQCTSLTRVVCSGETLSPMLLQCFHDKGPRAALYNLYGPTEATVDVTAWACPDKFTALTSVPIGKPIANTQIYILDSHGQPAPIGVAGEIYIGGEGVARGYLNRPELTAQRFLKDPFSAAPNARMYKTGDLGCWLPDGNIQFFGRNDFQVKIRGFRIELGEIEARLISHPSIQDAVVLARQDEHEDQPGDKRLVAYVVAQNGAQPDAETLRQHLASGLPEYMIPAAYVSLDSLPLSPNGKLDRQALPAPGIDAFSTSVFQEPQGETEILLAGLWQELLHIDRVGRFDNFFQLGGHSLLAISLIERMRQAGIETDLSTLLSTSNLAQFALALEETEITL